jgi:hypothetical protein
VKSGFYCDCIKDVLESYSIKKTSVAISGTNNETTLVSVMTLINMAASLQF